MPGPPPSSAAPAGGPPPEASVEGMRRDFHQNIDETEPNRESECRRGISRAPARFLWKSRGPWG
jgi:hypothetical protein